jgi:hypothetical protein
MEGQKASSIAVYAVNKDKTPTIYALQ